MLVLKYNKKIQIANPGVQRDKKKFNILPSNKKKVKCYACSYLIQFE